MQIRPLTLADLRDVADIDGTVESMHYLHLDRTGEGLAMTMRLEERDLRNKLIASNPIDDELNLAIKQVASGADEGIALGAEHDGQIVALAIAQPDPARGTMRLLDVRVDFDFRRQGLATALVYQIIQLARDAEFRAVVAETRTNNAPASRFLLKAGFELSGIDVRRNSNHDMVKEAATLVWYAAFD